jgi:hypothetical protein
LPFASSAAILSLGVIFLGITNHYFNVPILLGLTRQREGSTQVLGAFVGLRVRMQPQTTSVIIAAKKIPSATLSGMVLSVA